MSNFCTKCGSQLKPGEKFCGNCGAQNIEKAPTPEKSPIMQPSKKQAEEKTIDPQKGGSSLPQLPSKVKIILCVVAALVLLVLFFGSSSKKNTEPQPQGQAQQQGQTQQQNTAPTAQPRKNFGKIDDFWKALGATMATKEGSGYYMKAPEKEGLLTGLVLKENSHRSIVPESNIKNGNTPIYTKRDSNDYVNEVEVSFVQLKYQTDAAFDASYYGFILGCFVVVETLSPDMSQEEREQFLIGLNVITDQPEPGKWKKTYKDVEYSFENNFDIEKGMKFYARIPGSSK